jgi:DNA-binding transcriptional LysR family regulator
MANVFYESLAASVEAFDKACPQAQVRLAEMSAAEQIRALEEGRIDLGFTFLAPHSAPGAIHCACVGREALMVAVHERHDLARKSTIDLRSLSRVFFVVRSDEACPQTGAWLVEQCRRAGFIPRILQEADREESQLYFVAAGLGVALVPASSARLPYPGVVFRRLAPPPLADSYAVWRCDNESPLLEQYVKIVRALSQSPPASASVPKKSRRFVGATRAR